MRQQRQTQRNTGPTTEHKLGVCKPLDDDSWCCVRVCVQKQAQRRLQNDIGDTEKFSWAAVTKERARRTTEASNKREKDWAPCVRRKGGEHIAGGIDRAQEMCGNNESIKCVAAASKPESA